MEIISFTVCNKWFNTVCRGFKDFDGLGIEYWKNPLLNKRK